MTAKKRRPGRKRQSPFAAVIAVLFAIIVMCVLAVAIMRIDNSKVARYPVLYTGEILAAAADNSVPAPYIAAIIMAESSYDPNAVSSVGACGLMQIMPDTGVWIAGKFDEEFSQEALFEPSTSIRYGGWYLGFLMDRYGGNMRCATAAYHAGQGTVDKWLKNPEYSSDGMTLNVIPYDSTNTYVDRVMKYYDYYSLEYEKLTIE